MATELKFYDMKAKKSFTADNYKIVNKGNRKFAVAQSPHSDISCWRVMKRD